MKNAIAITHSNKFKILSFLSHRPFKISLRELLEFVYVKEEYEDDEVDYYEKFKEFFDYTSLKMENSLYFDNVFSAYASCKVFYTKLTDYEIKNFKDIYKNQNPYLNQIKSRNYTTKRFYLNCGDYSILLRYEEDLATYLYLQSLKDYFNLQVLLDIIDIPIKDFTFANYEFNTEKVFKLVKKDLQVNYPKPKKDPRIVQEIIDKNHS